MILEQEPSRPSTRFRTLGEASTVSARNRGCEAPALARELKGDLDWITMKALEKDRTRRYSSPSDLVADLRRYLGNEPVLARPASATYRAKKFVRRHRFGVAVASTLSILLVTFSIATAARHAESLASAIGQIKKPSFPSA
jgi:hypothetical protein